MKSLKLSFFALVTICLLRIPATPAAEQQTVESQLRERLRATMIQLREAEADRAAWQAAQAQWADEKTNLVQRIKALTKEANAGKLTAQTVETLKSREVQQEKEVAQLKEANESCQQASEAARIKQAERDKQVEETVIELERLVADRQAKNLALYKTANEILDRYEKFGLGDALAAREPFTGITRVKLQNLVQDYQDKIVNERTTLTEKDLPAFRDKLLK
jgi:hypothetical protein